MASASKSSSVQGPTSRSRWRATTTTRRPQRSASGNALNASPQDDDAVMPAPSLQVQLVDPALSKAVALAGGRRDAGRYQSAMSKARVEGHSGVPNRSRRRLSNRPMRRTRFDPRTAGGHAQRHPTLDRCPTSAGALRPPVQNPSHSRQGVIAAPRPHHASNSPQSLA
jgi:hypothetical protein